MVQALALTPCQSEVVGRSVDEEVPAVALLVAAGLVVIAMHQEVSLIAYNRIFYFLSSLSIYA